MARGSYRSVLSLCLANKSVSKIAKSLVTTPKTVRRIRDKATEMGLLALPMNDLFSTIAVIIRI